MSVRRQHSPDLKAIGQRVRELRGDTLQEDFAAELNISQGQLSKIERGKVAPALDTLLRLAALSGRTIDWLVRGE